jgi:hypothetical protein
MVLDFISGEALDRSEEAVELLLWAFLWAEHAYVVLTMATSLRKKSPLPHPFHVDPDNVKSALPMIHAAYSTFFDL